MNTTVLFYVPIECEFSVMVSDLRQVGGFSGYSGFLHQDITEILLKVVLNTITHNPNGLFFTH